MMKKFLPPILFLLIPLIAGSLIGITTAPGPWYAGLVKPWFNPPTWIFAPVWSALYLLIGLAGWLVWRRNESGWPLGFWFLQMLLNWAWSPVFFTFHAIGAALVIIVILLATIVAFVFVAWRADRRAALAFIPYGFWVGFAAVLNAALWRLN